MRHLLSAEQLTLENVRAILQRADDLAAGAAADVDRPLVATLFLSPSLRTRVGYEVATQRLRGSCVTVNELRFDSAMSAAESVPDALRTVSGMVDVVVSRAPHDLAQVVDIAQPSCPVINGGDIREHPSQALIDVAAIERFAGPVAEQRIALCGDLRMRAVTSLLQVLCLTPPRQLLLASPPSRSATIPTALQALSQVVEPEEILDVDVLLLPGLAPRVGSDDLAPDVRRRYAADARMLARLPDSAIVTSPMPVIDEMTDDVRRDPRNVMFEHSDHGVWVRAALLERMMSIQAR